MSATTITTRSSKTTRQHHTAQFKFTVVMDAIKRDNATEAARHHNVDWGLVNKWKRTFLEKGHMIFDVSPDKEKDHLEKKIEKLEQMIGKKEVELNLLKNFADFYQSRSIA
jgi:transposase-like protein